MRQNLFFARLVWREVVLGFLFGGVPVLIAFWRGGVEGIEKELSGLIPSDVVMWWSVALTALGILLQTVNHFTQKKSDFAEIFWEKLDEFCQEISPSLIGILRLVSGILIAFVCIWAWKDSDGFSIATGSYFVFIAIVSLGESAALTHWLAKIRSRQPSLFRN